MPDPTQDQTHLEKSIDLALHRANSLQPETAEFEKAVDQIAKLHKLKEAEKPAALSRDTVLLCLTNIAGIAMIIKHEQFNVITSKAMSFVPKPR